MGLGNNSHVATEHEVLYRNIDAAMVERGWSISELAKRAGVSPKVIYNFRGGQQMGMGTLYAIAKALGTTVEVLKGIEEAPADADKVTLLTQNEQDVLNYLRRLSPTNRRRAARLLREIVDELEETERSTQENSSTKSAGKPTPNAA
jgi:transcriptional regulator with XRE-family HTH domain